MAVYRTSYNLMTMYANPSYYFLIFPIILWFL